MMNIGITTQIIQDTSHGEIRDVLDINWINFITLAGFTPIIIPTGIDYESYIDYLKIEGLIFSGGNDLYTISKNNLSKIRDTKERLILEFAIKKSIPVYGICRGAQFIADYFGSALKKVLNHISINHKLEIVNQFWGSKYLNSENIVNSYHNYGIDSLSKELENIAIAEDGSIEAFKHKKLKIYAQMWHPERERPFKDIDINLMKDFFHNYQTK